MSEYMVLEYNVMYEISKTGICLIYLFSIRNLINDAFNSSECIARYGSVISE